AELRGAGIDAGFVEAGVAFLVEGMSRSGGQRRRDPVRPRCKLYIVIDDNGRRGWMQNFVNGPNGPGQTDENNGPGAGGPAPGDAHLTVVLLRLNPDGSIPDDNPFVDISASFQAPRSSGPDTAGPAVAGVVLHGVSQPGAGHVHRGHRLGEPGRP